MAALRVLVLSFALFSLILKGAFGVTESFVSTPNCTSAVCPNAVVEIQCTHTNVGPGATVWRGVPSTGMNCEATANHFSDNPSVTCTPGVVFTVDEITSAGPPPPDCLSSNATVTVAMFEGLTMQCLDALSLTNLIGSCIISFYLPPNATSDVYLSEDDIFRMTADLSSPPLITLQWNDSDSEAGIRRYIVTSDQLPEPLPAAVTMLNVSVELDTTDVFTVAAVDECEQMSPLSDTLIFRATVPGTPDITGGVIVLDQSDSSFMLTSLVWTPVDASPDPIAERGSGAILIDGDIRNYRVRALSKEPEVVPAACNSTHCSSPVLQGTLASGFTGSLVGVVAVNAIGEGSFRNLPGPCDSVFVRRDTISPTEVTLTCPVACTITYRSSQGVDMTAMSAESLTVIPGELYSYEATFECDVVSVIVQDSFSTCECPSSALFGETTPVVEATCPGFAGAVRSAENSNGVVCYEGTADMSTAVYVCNVGATCTGNCTAVCRCAAAGQAVGMWNVTFEQQDLCLVQTGEGLSTGAIVGIIIGAIIGLLLVAAIVALVVWLCCCRPDSGTPKKSKRNKKLTDEEHELREPSPITHDPNALYSNPTDIRHEAAPESHDQYAMPDTHTKKKPKTAPKAQESGELQKQVGPEGDVYTVPVRGSSKRKQESPPPSLPPPSEEQLAEMYATPDMTQKGRNKNIAPPLVYADIGVSASSRAAPVPPAGQVTYSTIAGTEPGPVEVVVEPTYAN